MFRKLTTIAACLTLLLVGPVWAQSGQRFLDGTKITGPIYGTLSGSITSDSVARVPRIDSNGNFMIVDAARDRTSNLYWSNAINDTVSPPATVRSEVMAWSAESTATLDVSSCRSIGLFIRFAPGAPVDTAVVTRFAVQVRAHPVQSQDSSSTYVWHPFRSAYSGTGTDSVGQTNPAFTQQQTEVSNRGEFVVAFSNRHYGATVVTPSQHPYSGQLGVYVRLVGKGGEPFWAPWMSVRIRLVTPSTSAGKPRIRLDIAGSPL